MNHKLEKLNSTRRDFLKASTGSVLLPGLMGVERAIANPLERSNQDLEQRAVQEFGLTPADEIIEQALRKTTPMYPELAIRELVANALIHQDFFSTGTGPMVELFEDRVEITNPGMPLVSTERFLDTPPKSRNEALTSLMRRKDSPAPCFFLTGRWVKWTGKTVSVPAICTPA